MDVLHLQLRNVRLSYICPHINTCTFYNMCVHVLLEFYSISSLNWYSSTYLHSTHFIHHLICALVGAQTLRSVCPRHDHLVHVFIYYLNLISCELAICSHNVCYTFLFYNNKCTYYFFFAFSVFVHHHCPFMSCGH